MALQAVLVAAMRNARGVQGRRCVLLPLLPQQATRAETGLVEDAVVNENTRVVGGLDVAPAGGKGCRGGYSALRTAQLERTIEGRRGELEVLERGGQLVCSRRDRLLAGAALRCADGSDEVIAGWSGRTVGPVLLPSREQIAYEARHRDGERRGEATES